MYPCIAADFYAQACADHTTGEVKHADDGADSAFADRFGETKPPQTAPFHHVRSYMQECIMVKFLPVLIFLFTTLLIPMDAHAQNLLCPLTGDGVYLYQHSNFAGKCSKFETSAAQLSSSIVGNDTASSIRVVGDFAATIYQNANFLGNATTFVSSATNFGNYFIGHDRASSISIIRGGCDGTPGVYLYQHSDHGGRCSKFTADAANFRQLYIQPKSASSLRFVGDWVVTLFSAENFGGTGATFSSADSSFENNSIQHDRAQSIRVLPRQRVCNGEPGVYLFDGRNFQGLCSRFTSSVRDLAGHLIGVRTASSIRIVGGYTATLVGKTASGVPVSSTFTASDADLGDNEIGDNRALAIDLVALAPEESRVERLQVRITTGDVKDAGTDDDVLVSLHQNNYTWLDYGVVQDFDSDRALFQRFDGDDFERNQTFSYDLLLNGIDRVKDIKWVALSKTGDGGWCVRRVELLVNSSRQALASQEFSPCRWLDNQGADSRGLTIPFVALRNSPGWKAENARPPQLFPFRLAPEEIVSRLHTAVGHALHGKRGYWGHLHGVGSVEVERLNNQAIKVDFDLSGDAPYVPDPEIDLDFDIEALCIEQSVRLEIKNIHVTADFDNIVEFLRFKEDEIADKVKAALPSASALTQEINTAPARCVSVMVLGDGTLEFTFGI
jgi:hypothetical protein